MTRTLTRTPSAFKDAERATALLNDRWIGKRRMIERRRDAELDRRFEAAGFPETDDPILDEIDREIEDEFNPELDVLDQLYVEARSWIVAKAVARIVVPMFRKREGAPSRIVITAPTLDDPRLEAIADDARVIPALLNNAGRWLGPRQKQRVGELAAVLLVASVLMKPGELRRAFGGFLVTTNEKGDLK